MRLDLFPTIGQGGEQVAHFVLHRNLGAQAQVGGHLLALPALNGFISVEVWTIAGQGHRAQAQLRRG